MSTGNKNINIRFGEDAPTSLTDNSGGTASDTIAVIGATYDQAEVANAVASLAAKIEALTQIVEK